MTRNHDLTEDIRAYWSRRAETFDLAFGHRIAPGAEARAWQQTMREQLPPPPAQVLELACGTGEVTRLVHDLGYDVTAVDFSEDMLKAAKAKHAGKARLRFLLADAARTMEPDVSYDAILCRHLVWTLVEPAEAFAEWFRLLRPGGRLLVFDGNWATPKRSGRWAARALALWERLSPDPYYDGAMSAQHASIMEQLPFGKGLTFGAVAPMLEDAGFAQVNRLSHAPISRVQRRTSGLRNRLRTRVYERFVLSAQKPF